MTDFGSTRVEVVQNVIKNVQQQQQQLKTDRSKKRCTISNCCSPIRWCGGSGGDAAETTFNDLDDKQCLMGKKDEKDASSAKTTAAAAITAFTRTKEKMDDISMSR